MENQTKKYFIWFQEFTMSTKGKQRVGRIISNRIIIRMCPCSTRSNFQWLWLVRLNFHCWRWRWKQFCSHQMGKLTSSRWSWQKRFSRCIPESSNVIFNNTWKKFKPCRGTNEGCQVSCRLWFSGSVLEASLRCHFGRTPSSCDTSQFSAYAWLPCNELRTCRWASFGTVTSRYSRKCCKNCS